MNRRLFLAIALSDDHKTILDSFRSVPIIDHPRWVPKANYHITLNFYGAVAEEKIDHLCETIKSITLKVKPFTMTVDKVEFAPPKRPRMLWVKMRENESFYTLVKQLEKTIPDKTGIAFGRNKMTPHITLARFKQPEALKVPPLPAVAIPPVLADACHLYESELTQNGPIYSIIRTFNLWR